jgi:protease-4
MKMGDYMSGFYKTFITKVAEGRHTTPDRIDAVGQGRVWTGAQAKERGLVDALGGLDTAVGIAKQRARIPADEEVELVMYSGRRSLYEALAELSRSSSAFRSWDALLNGAERQAMASLVAPVTTFRRGEPLALMPFAFVR